MIGKKVIANYTYASPNARGKLEEKTIRVPGVICDVTCGTHVAIRPDSIEVPPCFRNSWIKIENIEFS